MSYRAFDGYSAPQTANGVDGYSLVIRAQNATGTSARGGNLILGSGTGTLKDGYVKVQLGTTASVVFNADGYVSTDGYLKIDQLTLDGYSITFDGYAQAPLISQLAMPTPGIDGYTLTIRGQASTTSPGHGGNIAIKGGDGYNGDGYNRDGYVQLFGGTTEVIRIAVGKQIHLAGERFQVTAVAASPYNVLATDMNLLVDTTSARTINLPASPALGDAYRVKDSTGTAGTNNITIQGNGKNIEGAASNIINANFGKVAVVYNGTQWVIF